ncbi:family 43 glycosylhydrolase [Celerinatantimonas yamalensis]|uniref:Family 43 glycosylhydrolase n=1 Tax=Celerinatantimonas yamalensis TaxID=559956 RepID=A0ABW9G953_9GAMM
MNASQSLSQYPVTISNKPWMVVGSWFDDIMLTQLNTTTIKPSGQIYQLAQCEGSIEGASLIYHNGYFYLFVFVGRCCQDVQNTYQIRYDRASTITGPYLDKQGKSLLAGAGSLLVKGTQR